MSQNLSFQGKLRVVIYVGTFGLPTSLMLIVLLQPFYEPKWMFLDALTAAQLSKDCCHSYYGAVSNLGILLWTATATIMMFTGLVLFASNSEKSFAQFALAGGVLSGWLALDDLYLLHELVLPTLGVPQLAVIAIYIGLTALYVFTSWRIIAKSEFWILMVGGGALAVSVAVDSLFHSLAPQLVYIEDSAKFIGIFCWFSFHAFTAAKFLYLNIRAAR